MNDFDFGNYIYERRCKAGMTQAEMAERLGVTNKAVSKWETGKAKPTTNTSRKMAALFGLSVDELLQIREGVREMEITKITGTTKQMAISRNEVNVCNHLLHTSGKRKN